MDVSKVMEELILAKVRAVGDCRRCCFIRQSIYSLFFVAGHQRVVFSHVMESLFRTDTFFFFEFSYGEYKKETFLSIEPYSICTLVGKEKSFFSFFFFFSHTFTYKKYS